MSRARRLSVCGLNRRAESGLIPGSVYESSGDSYDFTIRG